MLLKSSRLIYRKFTQSHLPDYINLVMKEDVMKHITGVGLDQEQALERFQVALMLTRVGVIWVFWPLLKMKVGNL